MRNVLTAFLASPSDLPDERRMAFQVVAEVNEAIKSIDWSIDLLGWEDTLPGAGRPQALINRDVDRCDLFVGLLWRKWGTAPARDSRFSSGFEEEFSIARERHERASSPEIWMFFKTVDTAQTADAGPQLQNVINFRESLVESKAILFKEFGDTGAWEKILRKCLYRHVLSIARVTNAAPEGPSERATESAKSISTRADIPGATAAGDQVAVFARSLEPAFETGDLGEIVAALNDGHEAAFLAVRSVLLSSALVSASGTSITALPTHELNTLYRYRDRLRATAGELDVLFRSILADGFDHKPGWYWFRDYRAEDVVVDLIFVGLFGDESAARARSFEIIRRAHVTLFTRVSQEALSRSLREIPSDLRDAAWAYLVDIATPADLMLMREWATGTWLESRIKWVQDWAGSGRDLDNFLLTSPDPQLFPDPIKRSMRATIRSLADESLRAIISMPAFDMSEAAAAELGRRIPLIGEDRHATDGPGNRSRSLASLLGAAAGVPPGTGNAEEERLQRLGRENGDSLRASLDWYTLDGSTSYRILAERGEIPREVVRKDLEERFQRIHDESYQRIASKVGAEAAVQALQDIGKLDAFITQMFAAGALAALAVDHRRGRCDRPPIR
jgi:hypothetical protein